MICYLCGVLQCIDIYLITAQIYELKKLDKTVILFHIVSLAYSVGKKSSRD